MEEPNVNVTGRSDFHVFLKYLSYLVLLVVGVYLTLHVVVSVGSYFISYQTIDTIMSHSPFGRRFVTDKPSGEVAEQLKKIEAWKDTYFEEQGFSGKGFSIEFKDISDINAFICPSKQIVFTKGTLEEIQDDEALFFVLAHEIGHYKNKDTFRSIVKAVMVSLFLGFIEDEHAGEGAYGLLALSYSRSQEFDADCFAALKTQQVYGSTDGGKRFFEYVAQKQSSPQWSYYFKTHPAFTKRIANLKKCVK